MPLNLFVSTVLARSRLAPTETGVQLDIAPGSVALDAVLWPFVRAAIDLVTTGDRVRECDSDDRGWIFLDTSRGGRHRWSDRAGSGNLTKVRRFRARQTMQRGTA